MHWLFHVSLLLLVLSVRYYVAKVFVVQVSSNIQGEVGEHLVHLEKITQGTSKIEIMLVEISQNLK